MYHVSIASIVHTHECGDSHDRSSQCSKTQLFGRAGISSCRLPGKCRTTKIFVIVPRRARFRPCVPKALPHGHSRHDFAQHLGKRQRPTRLAHPCRIRPGTDRHRTPAPRRRGSRRSTRQYRVRARRVDHRSVPVGFSHGLCSARPSRPSNFILSLIYKAVSRPSFTSPTASSAM